MRFLAISKDGGSTAVSTYDVAMQEGDSVVLLQSGAIKLFI